MSQRSRPAVPLTILAAIHLAAIFGGFLAPNSALDQDRELIWAPPTRVRVIDADGRLHLRPFVYPLRPAPQDPGRYVEDHNDPAPLQFFVRGDRYRLAGLLETDLHLLGAEPPGKLLLMGTDGYGRDVFARLLVGGRISLFAGLLAAGMALTAGTLLGGLAGFYGGRTDALLMRLVELFLALPWLYLLLGVRAFLPLSLTSVQAFLLLVTVIGLIGWARPARLVRGVVLSARERQFVTAARGFGASDGHLIRRHVLPQTTGVVATQAAILIPRYILAEVTLSFLGLGIAQPTPSWGNLLAELQSYHVLSYYWWMTAPAAALVVVFLCYHALVGALRA